MNNFISMKDFEKEQIIEILNYASILKEKKDNTNICDKKIIASLFFEPSTRTRLSFTSAAFRVGAKVLGFDSPDATSIQKGETLRDTLKVINGYSDLIIMRHPRDGAAKLATDIVDIPVINAGDGSNEHPSQTMLDLFTIKEEFSTLENLKVAFLGDLKYGRTVHSLTEALSLFKTEFYFVANEILQIPKYILEDLDKKNIKYHILDKYDEILSEIDVLYVTRVQKERLPSLELYEKIKDDFIVNKESILNCKESMIILHPLPRINEINIDVDSTKHAKYFTQAKNGLIMRQAMIAIALRDKEIKKNQREKKIIIKKSEKIVCENPNCITHVENTENKVIEEKNKNFCYYCSREITL